MSNCDHRFLSKIYKAQKRCIMGKCPITGLGSDNVVANPAAGNKGTYNKDWWPNQLNLKILSQHSNKVNPLGD